MDDWESSHIKDLTQRLIHKKDIPNISDVVITMDTILEQGMRLVCDGIAAYPLLNC